MNQADFLNHIIAVLSKSMQRWRFLDVWENNAEVYFSNGNTCRIFCYRETWRTESDDEQLEKWLLARLNGCVRNAEGVCG